MAKKSKFYAVRKGIVPGIYRTWAECEANVKGFSGAEYKSFGTEPEAEDYMSGGTALEKKNPLDCGIELEYPYAFVDGSYNKNTGIAGWGGFLSLGDGSEDIPISGSESRPSWTAMRNVCGEVMGCMAAVAKALALGLPVLHVYHDYTGISCWPDGAWSANKPETRYYRDYIQDARQKGLKIVFHKVAGHTGVPGNEKADRMAKQAAGIMV